MSKLSASACRWREDGGGEAAGARSLAFIAELGIPVRLRQESDDFTQPITGLAICDGGVVIDPKVEIWPGDLLHEAGHIAVVEGERRPTLGALEPDQDEEYMAIAWSYAAAKICDVGLRELFHAEGEFVGHPRRDDLRLRVLEHKPGRAGQVARRMIPRVLAVHHHHPAKRPAGKVRREAVQAAQQGGFPAS